MKHVRELRGWLRRLFGLFNRQRREREFAEELESHMAFHIADNLRAGMSPEKAHRVVLIKLGGMTQVQEIHREQGGLPMLETFFQDLRFGARMLRKRKGFTIVAVVSLALGVGANTAIFGLLNVALFKTLPVKDAQQLVFLPSGTKLYFQLDKTLLLKRLTPQDSTIRLSSEPE